MANSDSDALIARLSSEAVEYQKYLVSLISLFLSAVTIGAAGWIITVERAINPNNPAGPLPATLTGYIKQHPSIIAALMLLTGTCFAFTALNITLGYLFASARLRLYSVLPHNERHPKAIFILRIGSGIPMISVLLIPWLLGRFALNSLPGWASLIASPPDFYVPGVKLLRSFQLGLGLFAALCFISLAWNIITILRRSRSESNDQGSSEPQCAAIASTTEPTELEREGSTTTARPSPAMLAGAILAGILLASVGATAPRNSPRSPED